MKDKRVEHRPLVIEYGSQQYLIWSYFLLSLNTVIVKYLSFYFLLIDWPSSGYSIF